MAEIKKLIESLDYQGLHKQLSENPSLANEGIPFDKNNPAKAHPLHRICDGVFHGVYSDAQATEIASIFLEHGSNIDGFGLLKKKDTPLIAAASLHAEKVGILYTDRGADIHHAGTHGGTALHWAAWTGRENLVNKLIRAGSDIHKRCIDFESTPLLWAVHGYTFDSGRNRHHQIECVRLLLEAGAEKNVSNKDGKSVVEFLGDEDAVLKAMLS
jgi:ankyrin repeat protein